MSVVVELLAVIGIFTLVVGVVYLISGVLNKVSPPKKGGKTPDDPTQEK